MRPVCLLDVDGVLNLLLRGKHIPDEDESAPGVYRAPRLGMDVRAAMYGHLQQFWRTDLADVVAPLRDHFELVWATYWQDEANGFWADKLGLNGPLPVLPLDFGQAARSPLCWKTHQVRMWLDANRPGACSVWFDDEVSRRDREWLPTGCRPLRCTPQFGLTPELVSIALEHLRTTDTGADHEAD